MARQATEIKVYWDTQDPSNESWAYVISDENGLLDSGSLDSDGDDLTGAINEAISISGLDLTVDDFGIERNVDGGYGIWTKDAS
jgi:hypothetical protein